MIVYLDKVDFYTQGEVDGDIADLNIRHICSNLKPLV